MRGHARDRGHRVGDPRPSVLVADRPSDMEVLVRCSVPMVEITVDDGLESLFHPAWQGLVAEHGTVFHTPAFLAEWWRHGRRDATSSLHTVLILDDDNVIGGCVFESTADRLAFAGGPDVTDYMGAVSLPGREDAVAAAVCEAVSGPLARPVTWLAGLTDDAIGGAVVEAIGAFNADAVAEVYDRAPIFRHDSTGYLASLKAKRRAEVLRKRERLTEEVGTLELVDSDPDTLRRFLDRLMAWKAKASSDTARFIDTYGEFLRDMVSGLASVGSAKVVELRADELILASAITLTHRGTCYLYNMSFDADLVASLSKPVSPGVVLVAQLAERAVDDGYDFDFLRGAQDYKLRLGGVPRDLRAVKLRA